MKLTLRSAIYACAAVALFLLAGCGEQKMVNLATVGVQIPDFSNGEKTKTFTSSEKTRSYETFNIQSSRTAIPPKYVKWFEKNGWRVSSRAQEISSLQIVLAKDTFQALVTYSPREGTSVQISKPETGAKP